MRYKKLSNEELGELAYLNLAAEVIETGYSICTISECLGYGRCTENNRFIRDRIFGEESELTCKEAIVLARLFGCSSDYLFDKKLSTHQGKPSAYFRHYEETQQREKEMAVIALVDKIRERLKSDNQFFGLIGKVIDADVNDITFKNPPEAATSQGKDQMND